MKIKKFDTAGAKNSHIMAGLLIGLYCKSILILSGGKILIFKYY